MRFVLLLSIWLLAVGCRADRDDILSSTYESKIKKLVSMLGPTFKMIDDVKVTMPYKVDDLSMLVEKFFPEINSNQACLESQQCAKNWMNDYNLVYQKLVEKDTFVEFARMTNSTLAGSDDDHINDLASLINRFETISKKTAKLFLKNCKKWDAGLKRMIYLVSRGAFFNRNEDLSTLKKLVEEMSQIRRGAKACDVRGEDKCLKIDTDLKELFKSSRNANKLLLAWKALHESIGASKMRENFQKAVELLNKSAVESGYKDMSEVWIEDFEEKNMERIMDKLFREVKPLYDQLHKHVRRRLAKFYRDDYGEDKGLLKVHLLGSLWGQDWEDIFELVKPFPDAKIPNVDEALKDKSYTRVGMFKEAERFFSSIGLHKLDQTFWKYSIIERPSGKEMDCEPQSFDFLNGFDYRVKMCTNLTEDDFILAHEGVANIEYYISYRNLYPVFRRAPNSAFEAAVGEAVSLSVMTPKHLKQIGLIDDDRTGNEQDINYLMKVALKKLAFIPFAYTVDKWRNEVFRGSITSRNYNSKWWELRERYQGIEPPTERSESAFDPGSFFNIANFSPFDRYFVSSLLQFQFYEALCRLSGHEGPLHKCDFYQSTKAGDKLKEMMSLGTKRHWTFALNILTGQKQIKIDAMTEYFKPLTSWLIRENSK